MECHYCHTLNRKFYCRQCLKDKLDSHNGELVQLEVERDKLVNEAAQFVKSTSRMRQLWSEKHNSISNIKKATEEKQRINKESEAARKRIQQLRIEIEKRRNRLENVDRCHIEKAMEDCTKDIQHIKQQWYRVHKMTVSARRVLVQEIVSLFDFKPGVVEDSSTMIMESPRPISLTCSNSSTTTTSTTTTITTTNTLPFAQRDRSLSLHHRNSNNNQYQSPSSKYPQQQQQQQPEDLYICGVTLPARVIDVSKYSKEELNAAIGHLIHMFGVIIRYLGVKLPFPIYYKTMYPYIRSTIAKQRHNR
ncbi:hypothetical protein INT45_001665 [Circinella minor]|uniref:Autophagy-related protein 14 n=1 Tax=Circinella minor TaxID=1195481 RepID=A0A8H7VP29_9FUNG|nr:hypothetical protein INT45_001665 [Circinella minor]